MPTEIRKKKEMKSTLVANSLWALEFSAKAHGTIGSIQLKDLGLGPNRSSVLYQTSLGIEAEARYWTISNEVGFVCAGVESASKTRFSCGRAPNIIPRSATDSWLKVFIYSLAEDSDEIARSQLLSKFPQKNLEDLPAEQRALVATEIGEFPFAPAFKARFGSILVCLAEASIEVRDQDSQMRITGLTFSGSSRRHGACS